MNNYPLTNQVYSSYFAGNFPPRVCIAVSDLPAKTKRLVCGAAFSNMANTKKEILVPEKTQVR
jgi:hypothetical protein